MNILLRSHARFLALPALLCACSSPPPRAESRAESPAERVTVTVAPLTAPAPPPSLTLDAYKTHVAHRIMERNPERIFDGRLPPLLPAIVVLTITVDGEGRLADVQVQRSRDPDAAAVALASLHRSGPLPRPGGLAADGRAMTFSETFLFAEPDRFQIRSVAGPQ